jgi:hypothetical protein
MELANPDYPELKRIWDTTMTWGIPNCDNIYLYSALGGNRRYRVWGDVGELHYLDFQVNGGHFSRAPDFTKISSCTVDDLAIGGDGSFELFISKERMGENWMPLGDDATFFFVREYFYDWEKHRPANVFIENLDATYPPPALEYPDIEKRVEHFIEWFEKGARGWRNYVTACFAVGVNQVVFVSPSAEGGAEEKGVDNIHYGMGNFVCGEDEAVVYEVTPPNCLYWSVHLGTMFWEQTDWGNRQGSLNGTQAVLDSDGAFRAVIAQKDPGVPNWLDCAGQQYGTVQARYLVTDDAPQPVTRVVPLRELRAHLPSETPVVTPEERSRALRRRQELVWRRNRN